MDRYFLPYVFSLILLGGFSASLAAQADTTVYQVVEEMPRFPTACEQMDTTLTFKQQCANQAMLEYVYGSIVYPQEAIQENIEGTAVVSFIVEPDGSITDPQVMRDLGGGTGIAALGVVLRMQEEGIRWVPGKQRGEAVRVAFNLPVRFKLEDPDPFIMAGRDTVYTEPDTPLNYEGGAEALQAFLDNEIQYPDSGLDSCQMGQIDIQVLIEADGNVRILDMTDYNELGFDFWYAAIDAATSTYGNWIPATFEGRPVNAAFDLSLSFLPPDDAACQTATESFLAARTQAEEGAALFNDGQIEEGLAKMTAAIETFPRDAQLRILRGQAYLNNNQLQEACNDLSVARRIALVRWYDSVLPLICR